MRKISLILSIVCLLSVCGPLVQQGSVSAAPASAGDMAAVVSGNNSFALEMYRALSEGTGQKGKNLFFSPFSLSSALAMTYAGARTETEAQMAKVMHFDLKQQDLHPAFSTLLGRMQGRTGYLLFVANALWPQKDYPFLPDFMQTGTSYYKAGLQPLDYVGDAGGARLVINKWVEDHTQNKIKNLIGLNVLTPLTRLVLTNAIYFKGNWDTQFDPKSTRPMSFRLSDGQSVQVPMMYLDKTFSYMEGDMFQMLELPYVGKELSMVIILPSREAGIEKVETLLTPASLDRWISSMAEEKLPVYLPKFKLACAYSLAAELGKMGMPAAFDVNRADFSGMTGHKDLYISHVLHKAFVEVNEEGTEAAAATAVVMALKSMPLGPQFRADRPFIFMIRDKKTGSILFAGRVMNPLETGE